MGARYLTEAHKIVLDQRDIEIQFPSGMPV